MNIEQHTEEHYDPVSNSMGMWLFLFTEVMLFGVMFILYAMYLHTYGIDFRHGSGQLNLVMGGLNTVVLITSSLTMALAIWALSLGQRSKSFLFLGATIALAGGFLVVKSFEWAAKFHHGIYPGSAELLSRSPGEMVFFSLYFVMTGLHAFHVIIGMILITVNAGFLAKGKMSPERMDLMKNTGLYWHLVDLIWIFLFPLFYLIV
ncbi:MAG: cytochrome c oxidase subunit 3 family protein [Fibrobacteria bacterium]|nr:cytochrome c oxidase subunit 3 family protein [Fibrobacteria bacterium]